LFHAAAPHQNKLFKTWTELAYFEYMHIRILDLINKRKRWMHAVFGSILERMSPAYLLAFLSVSGFFPAMSTAPSRLVSKDLNAKSVALS